MYKKDTCFIQIQMEEEDMVVEEAVDLAEVKTTKDKPMNQTSTTDKMLQTRKGRFAKGGANMTNQVDKTTPPNVDIVVNLATMRKSVERRRVSWHLRVENSLTMLGTRIMTTMVKCS